MRHAKSLKCFPVVIVVIIIIVIIIIIIIIIIINIYLIRLFFLSCLAHVCVFVGNSNQGRGGSNEQTLHKGLWPFYVRSERRMVSRVQYQLLVFPRLSLVFGFSHSVADWH